MKRRDAKQIKNLDGLSQLCIDLKPKRSVSDVFINQEMDVTNLVKYIEKKKKNGEDITYFHAFLSALGKLFYSREKLNRFVANRHIWEHNEIILSFVAKVSFDDRSEELMILVPIEETDNLESISKKVRNKVEKIRNKTGESKGANNAMAIIGKIPNILRVPFVGLAKIFDKFGLLPNAFMEDNLYYSSMIVSNLGSIGCGAIFHNINDFGTCSSLATIGEIKEKVVDGKKRYFCEFGVNLDERIADGYYFVKSLKMLQYIFDNPKLLEEDASKKIKMEEIRKN